jgi:hypothetical protein
MRRLLIALLLVFASLPVAGVNTVVVMRHPAAAVTPPSATGSVLEFSLTNANTGTVSTMITVPADATFVTVGISGYEPTADFFSGGSMKFTKGGADTAMTTAKTGTNSGDHLTTVFMSAMFYLVAPDTGANKTLKWDWVGTATATNAPKISVTFWKGVNQSTPVRGAGGGQSLTSTPYTTSTITAASGDLIVAWVGAFARTEGTADSWTSATLLSQVALNSVYCDGAWATASPTGDQTVACATDTNWDDGGIVAISLEPVP